MTSDHEKDFFSSIHQREHKEAGINIYVMVADHSR